MGSSTIPRSDCVSGSYPNACCTVCATVVCSLLPAQVEKVDTISLGHPKHSHYGCLDLPPHIVDTGSTKTVIVRYAQGSFSVVYAPGSLAHIVHITWAEHAAALLCCAAELLNCCDLAPSHISPAHLSYAPHIATGCRRRTGGTGDDGGAGSSKSGCI